MIQSRKRINSINSLVQNISLVSFYKQPHLHKRENYLRTTRRCTLFTTIRICHAILQCDVAANKSTGNSNCCRNRALSGFKSFSYCFSSSGTGFHSFQKDLEWFIKVFGSYYGGCCNFYFCSRIKHFRIWHSTCLLIELIYSIDDFTQNMHILPPDATNTDNQKKNHLSFVWFFAILWTKGSKFKALIKQYTVKSEIKAAPNYKPLPIIGRTKLPNLYNISRSLL